MVIGGIVLFLFILGVGGAAYAVYWFKNKALDRVADYTGGAIGPAKVKVANGRTCGMLPREDLQQILGVVVEKSTEIMEGSDPGCAYYTNPEAFAQLQRLAVAQAQRDAEEAQKQPAPKSDNPLALLKDVNKLEGVVKSIGLTDPEKEGRVFAFTLERDFGRRNWSTTRAALSVVPGFEEMTGIGDRAVLGSFGHMMMVLKGDSLLKLELTVVPEAKIKGAEIGRKIVERM
jgi:hypothetical protein